MSFSFSRFGQRIQNGSGIEQLMDDLGNALAESAAPHRQLTEPVVRPTESTAVGPTMHMLGGGNPAAIPEVAALWRKTTRELLDNNPDRFDRMLVNYDPSRGNPKFLSAVVDFFNERFGWNICSKNVVVTNGGQTAFFYLINLLAGQHHDGSFRQIVLPLVPEYIGYANQGLTDGYFRANRPKIDVVDDTTFKYRVDFDSLKLQPTDAAICVSRPTNPTGNVLTNEEVSRLAELASGANIPLIIDNAYGAPFPNIVFGDDVVPPWGENIVHTFSLSKLGLPGTRTGIVIGPPEITAALSSLNAVAGLANGNLGQVLVTELLRNHELARISSEVIQPFYLEKSRLAQSLVRELLPKGAAKVHVSQGALFLWLWLNMSVTSRELYSRLKSRGVLVVPGEYFFYGLSEEWEHQHQCIRMTFSMSEETVRAGVSILAEELAQVAL